MCRPRAALWPTTGPAPRRHDRVAIVQRPPGGHPMPRLTSFLLRHKLAVVAAWLVVLVAGGAAAGVVPGRLSQEFSFPGEEGYEANVAILEAYGNGGPGNPLVPVVELPDGTTADSPGTRDALDRAFA